MGLKVHLGEPVSSCARAGPLNVKASMPFSSSSAITFISSNLFDSEPVSYVFHGVLLIELVSQLGQN